MSHKLIGLRRAEDSNPYLLRHPGFRSRLQTIPRRPPKIGEHDGDATVK